MKTDRELLELAAKAAGIPTVDLYDSIGDYGEIEVPGWNPLEDDGDALRLAVKLGIEPQFIVNNAGTHLVWVDLKFKEIVENAEDDPYAATRRAIVRAAATIGETL